MESRLGFTCLWGWAFLLLFLSAPVVAEKVKLDPSNWGHSGGDECVSCHKKASAGVVTEWQQSAHAEAGVNCMDCHQAKSEEIDAFEHEGQIIATIVSPTDCGRCHDREFSEHKGSVHSEAVALGNADRSVLGDNLAGPALTTSGCDQCHGSVVKVKGDGTLDPATWPNSGIGRINPDGSKGSCSACHGRHRFSKAQARQPIACARCHASPKSPDQAVFDSSKHGMAYQAHIGDMNLDSDSWSAGKDYSAAPTCVTCHMGAAGKVAATHDVGMRSAWGLYGPVSERQHLVMFEDGDKREWPVSADAPKRGAEMQKLDGNPGTVKFVATPDRRRQVMSAVCRECHSKSFANGFMDQFDQLVELFNTKFGAPSQAIMQSLYQQGLLTPAPFDEPIEFIYWDLWHEHGAAARHGAAMASPDHSAFAGMYAVARSFYGEFLPQVRAVAGVGAVDLIQQHVLSQPAHNWLGQPDQASAVLGSLPDATGERRDE
ncbi:MAG: hypothetical protein C0631_07350 [Sedimenticola sp.]|nr:MAG: hypothetical protein C0631_07350 [Sedimenticola sp.]